jgi:hypothetical protein
VDRYGRTVARMYIDGKDVSLELGRAGLAWHFTRYSSDPVLADAEREARAAKRGLWVQPNPVPPWEYRHPRPAADSVTGPFHGDAQSGVFHAPNCRQYNCANCTRSFATVSEGEAAGFRPHIECVTRRSATRRDSEHRQ